MVQRVGTGQLGTMTRRDTMRLAGLSVAAGASALVGCGSLRRPAKYRFRMTVEVQTPAGVKRGWSVMEETAYETWRLTSEEHAGGGGLRGEAVIVDLPSGPLFALLTTGDARQPLDVEVTRALSGVAPLNPVSVYVRAVKDLGRNVGLTAGLPRKRWPLMVRFRNLSDPRTVEQVDPDAIGVRRVIIQTTTEPITAVLQRRLEWLSTQVGSLVKRPANVAISDMPRVQRLTEMDFSTDIKRR